MSLVSIGVIGHEPPVRLKLCLSRVILQQPFGKRPLLGVVFILDGQSRAGSPGRAVYAVNIKKPLARLCYACIKQSRTRCNCSHEPPANKRARAENKNNITRYQTQSQTNKPTNKQLITLFNQASNLKPLFNLLNSLLKHMGST